MGDLEAVIYGDGSRVGVTRKESVFGVKFLDRPGGAVIPAGGMMWSGFTTGMIELAK